MQTDVLDIRGKVALVTGGAKRLGAAVCRALAGQGAHVVLHYRSSRREAEELARELRACGVACWLVQADFSASAAVAPFWESVLEAAGGVDFLINSASIFPAQKFDEMTPEQVHHNVEVNALAPMELARRFARQGREGAIINFIDTRAFDYDQGHVPYHLSKRMLHTLTRIMAMEFAPGIRVNAIAPGLVLPPEGEDEGYLESLKHTNPLQRYGSPHGIAAAAVFLLKSGFITGQTLYVDGGRHLRANFYG